MNLKRSDAAKLIENLRTRLANAKIQGKMIDPAALETDLYEDFGIEFLKPCDGEAHSNPYIDRCGKCSPRWGLIGEPVTIR